jgi:glycosyltransferase involved in cell wall biosynthesis
MLLTVLICSHSVNDFYDDLLIRSLQSLKNQTYKNFKVVLVLDQCWTNTKKLIESLDYGLNIKIIEKSKKEGLSFAKNYGLGYVDTEWVGFLDSDDLYEPNKIETQINHIIKNEVDFLGTKAWYIDSLNETDKYPNLDTYGKLSSVEQDFNETHEQIKEKIYQKNVLTHGSMIVKKSCIDSLGGYRDIRGMEDWDLWKRGFDAGFKFYQIQDKLYIYRLNTSVPV